MPDYDLKSIPVLNDVIKDDDSTDEHEVVDLGNLNALPDDDNIDLFVDDLTESIDDAEVTPLENLSAETIDSESTSPEIGDINDVADQNNNLSGDAAAIGVSAFSTLKDEERAASISDEMNTAIGNNEKIISKEDNTPSVDLPEDEPEIESTLIDYGVKEGIITAEVEAPLITTLEEPAVETVAQHADTPATPAISLETLTEDIVKQIMPGLEEQLRHLVQQALAEKLPEELVTNSSTDDDQNNDHEQ